MVVKRRSPTEVLEAEKNKKGEHSYMKFPRDEPIDVTLASLMTRNYRNPWKRRRVWVEKGKKKFCGIHTHPARYVDENREISKINSIPSGIDLFNFLTQDQETSMTIAQRDTNTGKIQGYFILRKTKQTPPCNDDYLQKGYLRNVFSNIWSQIKDPGIRHFLLESATLRHAEATWEATEKNQPAIAYASLKRIAEQYHLHYRFVPAEGYKLNPSKTAFIQAIPTELERQKSLEQKASATTALVGILGSIFFIGANLTGNTIANLSTNTTSWVGAVLLAIGLVAGVFWVRSKRK